VANLVVSIADIGTSEHVTRTGPDAAQLLVSGGRCGFRWTALFGSIGERLPLRILAMTERSERPTFDRTSSMIIEIEWKPAI
jgi:hypothetical protein